MLIVFFLYYIVIWYVRRFSFDFVISFFSFDFHNCQNAKFVYNGYDYFNFVTNFFINRLNQEIYKIIYYVHNERY